MDVRIMGGKTMLLPELIALLALVVSTDSSVGQESSAATVVAPKSANVDVQSIPEKDYGFEDWARLLGRNAVLLDHDLEECVRHCTETIQIAQVCQQSAVVAIAMMQRASARAGLSGIEAGESEFRRALELFPLTNQQNYHLLFTHALFQHQRMLGLSHTIFVPVPSMSELTMPTPNSSREIRCRLLQDLMACRLDDRLMPEKALMDCCATLSSQVKSDVQTRQEVLTLRCELMSKSERRLSEILKIAVIIRNRPDFSGLTREIRISTLLLIADLEHQLDHDPDAITTLTEALTLAEELGHQTIIVMCHARLISVLNDQGDQYRIQQSFNSVYPLISAVNCPATLQKLSGLALQLPNRGTGVYKRPEIREAILERIQRLKSTARTTSQTLGEWNASRASRMLAMQSQRISAAQLRADEESQRSLRFSRIAVAVFCGLAIVLLRERWKLRNANRRLKEEILNADQQRMENERIELRLAQTERLESLGALAGGIAHDFNNLLVGVIGNADLLRYLEPGSPAGVQCLEGIIRSAETAAGLSRKMLAYAGKQPASKKVVDLNDAVSRMLPLLRAGLGGRHSITFDPDPAPLKTEGDVEQIDQILLNLITNAAQAMNEIQGTILIRTGCDFLPDNPVDTPTFGNRRKGGEFVWFEVIDCGRGIAEADFSRVFQPFFSTKPKPTGHGFGLSVVYGHVNRHDGLIQLTSSPGQGSRFRILLPRSNGPERVESVGVQPAPLSTLPRQLRIAAVDDQKESLDVIRRTIELIGGQAELFTNATEALEHLIEHRSFDCLLLDLLMSPLDGPAMLEVLHAKGIQIPVILMTGCSTEGIPAIAGHMPVQAVLQKPFRPEELITRVHKVLSIDQPVSDTLVVSDKAEVTR